MRRIKRPELLNPKFEDDTKGRELLQLQENHKVHWQEYTFQEVIHAVAIKAIVADVDAQYVEQLEENYFSYKNQKSDNVQAGPDVVRHHDQGKDRHQGTLPQAVERHA